MSLYSQCFGNEIHTQTKLILNNACETYVQKCHRVERKSQNNKIMATFPPQKISLRRSFKIKHKINESQKCENQEIPEFYLNKPEKESFNIPCLNKLPNYSISLSNSPEKHRFVSIPTKKPEIKYERNFEALQTTEFIQQKQLAKTNVTISYISPTERETAHSRNDSINRDYQQFQTHKNSFISLEWKETSLGTSQALRGEDKHFENIFNNSKAQNRLQPFRWINQETGMKTEKTIMKTEKSSSLLGTLKLVSFQNEDQEKSQKGRKNSVCKSLRAFPQMPYLLEEINYKRAESIMDVADELENEFSEVIIGTRKDFIETKIGKKKEFYLQNTDHLLTMRGKRSMTSVTLRK